MGEEFIHAAVSDDAAGSQDVGRHGRRVRDEPGRLRCVDRPVARHVQQRGHCRPAHRRHQQVGLDGATIGQVDPAEHAPAPVRAYDVLALSRIDDRRDVDAYPAQVLGRRIPGGVGRQDYGALSRPHAVEVDQAAYRGGEHHAGKVVPVEDVRALDQSGRDDEHRGAGLDQPFGHARQSTLDHAQPVVVVAA